MGFYGPLSLKYPCGIVIITGKVRGFEMANRVERRKESRHEIIGDVLWSYSEAGRDIFEGGIIDQSKSGLSMFTHTPVEEGRVLKIYARGVWTDERYAKVVWCKKVSPDVYRSGLELIRQ